jgi:hypothetical protein
MATAPQYAATPRTAAVTISTANTGRDGTGTIGDVITAVAAGTRIDDLYITAAGATTAGVVRMFLKQSSTYKLVQEFIVTAVTPSTTVPVWTAFVNNLGIILADATWSLSFSTNNAESFNIVVTRAGDLT